MSARAGAPGTPVKGEKATLPNDYGLYLRHHTAPSPSVPPHPVKGGEKNQETPLLPEEGCPRRGAGWWEPERSILALSSSEETRS